MGAVQSGKTASMLAVAAHAMDAGVNVLVLLAGTRTTLWLQTLERLKAQLDTAPEPGKRRLLAPTFDFSRANLVTGTPHHLYRLNRAHVARVLGKGRPLMLVVMKQVDHISHASSALHDVVFPEAAKVGVKVRMIVIDDEADDSSISGSESAATARELQSMKQVPRRILDLWEDRQRPGESVAEHVFATYVGYTATPQANFLQDPQNPLAPRDFVASLRTPGPSGALEPRALTYRVPEGVDGWYTGSDVYYRDLADEILVVRDDEGDEGAQGAEDEPEETIDRDAIADATRAYLVAASIRLLRQPGRLGPETARSRSFDTAREAEQLACKPSSMLIHPSSAKQDHFAVAEAVRLWWRGANGAGDDASGVLADIDERPEAWKAWLDSYANSADAVFERFEKKQPTTTRRAIPEWDGVRRVIIEELVPSTRIAVVNSDPNADDRPRFNPVRAEVGWSAAPDLSTIFVSGNVMARGLTLEGLLTTLFTRDSKAPLADTQMQMQRWFGYRGSYIDLVRVFLSERQRSLFAAYGDTDHALREQVLAAMNQSEAGLPDFTVLQGEAFQATGKVGGVRSLPLSPGRRPFVRHLSGAGDDEANLAVVSDHFRDALERQDLVETRRGLIDRETFSMDKVADLLDSLRYSDHFALPAERRRWSTYGRLAGIAPPPELYRAPELDGTSLDLGNSSPYTIAAYLRFWSASLDHHVRGLYTDEDVPRQWSLLDLQAKRAAQPRFRIGLRFGTGDEVSEGPLDSLAARLQVPVRSMKRDVGPNGLVAAWGSRGATADGYRSDDLFDVQVLGLEPTLMPDGTRATGEAGLVLFHLIDDGSGRGSIAVGLSIPAGGPDFIHATTSSRWDDAGA